MADTNIGFLLKTQAITAERSDHGMTECMPCEISRGEVYRRTVRLLGISFEAVRYSADAYEIQVAIIAGFTHTAILRDYLPKELLGGTANFLFAVRFLLLPSTEGALSTPVQLLARVSIINSKRHISQCQRDMVPVHHLPTCCCGVHVVCAANQNAEFHHLPTRSKPAQPLAERGKEKGT